MKFQTFMGGVFMVACTICILMYSIQQNCIGFFFGLIGISTGFSYHAFEKTGMFDEMDKPK